MKITSAAKKTQEQTYGDAVPLTGESPEARVRRMYAAACGPLMAWLQEEAGLRGHQVQEMARELGVTSGYISQLKSGIRRVEHISGEFAVACARYLGVPAVVVKILSGKIAMSDFVWPHQDEEVVVTRAFARMMTDPVVKLSLSEPSNAYSMEVKRALVMLYAESSGQDVLGLRELPSLVQWLLRATESHNSAEVERDAVASGQLLLNA